MSGFENGIEGRVVGCVCGGGGGGGGLALAIV